MTKFLRTPFLQNMSGRLFLKFVQYLFLESFCASLDKSVLLHRRYLMSKFTEMLILLFIRLYMKIFSIAWQEFNPFYPHRVLCDRKHFCSILTDLSNHLFLFHQNFSLLSQDVKNVLTKQFPKMQRQWFANVLQKQ